MNRTKYKEKHTHSIIIIIIIITSPRSEKRKKVIHTKAHILNLVSAQRSSSHSSLLVLQLKRTMLGRLDYKGRKHIRGEFCLPQYHQSWAWIYSHPVFVQNDEICRRLDPKRKKETYIKKAEVPGHLLLLTSRAGFHHRSTKITLLQAVKLRPTLQTNNEASSLPSEKSTTHQCSLPWTKSRWHGW